MLILSDYCETRGTRISTIMSYDRKKAEAVGVKNTNRLIENDFENSKTEKLLNKLLARYITIKNYLI